MSATSPISAQPPNDSPPSASAFRPWNGSLGWDWTTAPRSNRRMTEQWATNFSIFEKVDGKPRAVAPRARLFPRRLCHAAERQRGRGRLRSGLQSRAQCSPGRGRGLGRRRRDGRRQAGPEQCDGHPAVRARLRRERADDNAAERRGNLKGFALGVFSVPDLLGVALRAQRHVQPELLAGRRDRPRRAHDIWPQTAPARRSTIVLSSEGLFRDACDHRRQDRHQRRRSQLDLSRRADGGLFRHATPTAAPTTCCSAACC